MATEDFAERTEPATPKKRGEARRKGQLPISQEMQTAWTLLAFTALFAGVGSEIVSQSSELVRRSIERIQAPVASLFADGGAGIVAVIVEETFVLALPILAGGLFVGITIGLLQTSFLFAPEKLVPDIKRLDPTQGLKRFLSMRSVVKVSTAIVKFILLGAIVWVTLVAAWEAAHPLIDASVRETLAHLGDTVMTILLRVALALLFLSIFDLLYQRWQYEKDLKMTKQEVKEEAKQAEGNPEVRRRIRQRQREFSRNRMIAEVESATVVIVNPTHYAVALRYDEGVDAAPKIIAKGQGYIALRIRAAAERAGRPIIERPELARLLYRQVEVGSEIPESLFLAVAEILAHLFKRPQPV